MIRKYYRKNIAYQIKWQDCNHTYIGESGRKFKEQLNEHRRDIAWSETCHKFISIARKTALIYPLITPNREYW